MKLSEFTTNEQQAKDNTTQKNDRVEDLYNVYKDMNSAELMQELKNQVSKQKQEGTFDYNKLSSTINQVLPYLSDNQKNNLLSILNSLK